MVRASLRKGALAFINGVMRWERWILAALALAFVASFSMLLLRFYHQSTVLVPTVGGTYIEGSVGELLPWNPWFTVSNDGLLGGTANTDSRVFANTDRTILIELDIAADTSASAATTDYPAYQGAASKQVTTQTGTSTPSTSSAGASARPSHGCSSASASST